MATESDGEEEAVAAADARVLTGTPQLSVDDDLREMAKKAAWSVSSCKPGNGVLSLRDDNLDTYWQLSPHAALLLPSFFSDPFAMSVLLLLFFAIRLQWVDLVV